MNRSIIRKEKGEEITMPGKERCIFCGKEAIGSQGSGCFVAHVCREHADNLLLALGPGEIKSFGDCYMIRFKENE